jgi:glycosyltransferase involved in cell wall biosynthesis
LLDASIIHLRRTDLFRTVIPSKLFECMAMGIPVLHGVEGESAEIVEQEAVGLLFEPENPDALLAAVVQLANDPALRQKLAASGPRGVRQYDRHVLAGKMLESIKASLAD